MRKLFIALGFLCLSSISYSEITAISGNFVDNNDVYQPNSALSVSSASTQYFVVGSTPIKNFVSVGSGTATGSLTSGNTYYYKVWPFLTNNKTGFPSKEISKLIDGSTNSVILTWEGTPNATRYKITRAEENGVCGTGCYTGYYLTTATTFTDKWSVPVATAGWNSGSAFPSGSNDAAYVSGSIYLPASIGAINWYDYTLDQTGGGISNTSAGEVEFYPGHGAAQGIYYFDDPDKTAKIYFVTDTASPYINFNSAVGQIRTGGRSGIDIYAGSTVTLRANNLDTLTVNYDGNVGVERNNFYWKSNEGVFRGILDHTNSAERTWLFPDKDGTVAMTSDIAAGSADNLGSHVATKTITADYGMYTSSCIGMGVSECTSLIHQRSTSYDKLGMTIDLNNSPTSTFYLFKLKIYDTPFASMGFRPFSWGSSPSDYSGFIWADLNGYEMMKLNVNNGNYGLHITTTADAGSKFYGTAALNVGGNALIGNALQNGLTNAPPNGMTVQGPVIFQSTGAISSTFTVGGSIIAGSGSNQITTTEGLLDATKLTGLVPNASIDNSSVTKNGQLVGGSNIALSVAGAKTTIAIWSYPTFTSTVTVAASIVLNSSRPASIAVDQNDYYVGTRSVVLSTNTVAVNITGILGGWGDRLIYFVNVGTNTITFKPENAGSAAANRIMYSGDKTLAENKTLLFFYDAIKSRWRILD